MAALTPLSAPTEETVLLPPSSAGNEKLCREIPTVEPEFINVSTPDYTDVPLVGFTRWDLSRVFPWVKFEAQSMCEPPWRTELAQIQMRRLDILPPSLLGFNGGESEVELGHCCLEVSSTLAKR